jgi:hypothetical protein
MNDRELDGWRRQLLTDLAAAHGAPVPLRPLLRRLVGLPPQQRFECLQWLLEQTGAELVRSEGEYRLIEGWPGPLSDGEWVDLAAAVASAGTDPGDEFSIQSSPYMPLPFRFRSVGIFSGQTRDYHPA